MPPVFPDDEEKTHTTTNLFLMLGIGSAGLLLLVIVLSPMMSPLLETACLLFGLSQFTLLYFVKRGYVRSVVFVNILFLWSLMMVNAIDSGGLQSNAYLSGGILSSLLAGFLLQRRYMVVFASITVLFGGFLAWLQLNGMLPQIQTSVTSVSSLIVSTFFLLMASGFAYVMVHGVQKALDNARRQLQERADIEQKLRQKISELQKAEETLKLERELLRVVVDNLPDNIYVKDREGKFLLNNRVSLQILGASMQEETLGKDDFDFFPRELAEQWRIEQQEIIAQDKRILNEEVFQPWNKHSRRWIVASTLPLHNSAGEVIGLVGINRDITEYKLAEENAQRSEAIVRALLDATPDVAFMITGDGTILIANRTLANFLQHNPQELVGKNLFELLAPIANEKRLKRFRDVIETRQPARWDDGDETVWWDNTVYPITLPGSNTEVFSVYGRDIHVRKRLEAELQRYTAELERMVEERTAELRTAKDQIEVIIRNTNNAIALFHPNGDVQMANPAFETIFDKKAAKSIEQLLWFVADSNSLAAIAQSMLNAIKEKERSHLSTRFQCADGIERDIDLTFVPVTPSEDTEMSVVVSAHDITHIKEIARFKERFVANAVHDLSTPIAGLSTRLYLLKRNPERLEDHVLSLERQVEHLKNLLEDLRMLSQLDSQEVLTVHTPTDFNAIVRRVFDTYEPVALEKFQRLRLEVTPNLPLIRLDSRQIERVIVNLVTNAIHYTPVEKEIIIKTYQQENWLILEVADEGIGIALEDQARVFERFYRTDKARAARSGGTGLGLAIVKEVVELHGGSISLASEVGEGSTFIVRLPV